MKETCPECDEQEFRHFLSEGAGMAPTGGQSSYGVITGTRTESCSRSVWIVMRCSTNTQPTICCIKQTAVMIL